MNIEDRLRSSLVAQVEAPPEIPALLGNVTHQARALRRRRRTTAVVATSVAALAIAVPFALVAGGGAKGAPAHRPSVSASVTPPADPMSVALLEVDLSQRRGSLVRGDATQDLGALLDAPTFGAYETVAGVAFVADSQVKLAPPSGSLVVLSGSATVTGMAVSADGRQIAWGERNAKGDSNRLVLYDLATRTVAHQLATPSQVEPVGMLSDGRVAVVRDAAGEPSQFWQPGTGVLTTVSGEHPHVSGAVGHVVIHSLENHGCTTSLADTATGRETTIAEALGCLFVYSASPDGGRWLAAPFTAPDQATVELVDGASGKADTRLSRLLLGQQVSVVDFSWLDDGHVLLVVNRPGSGAGREQVELSCAVPVNAAPTCATVRDLGPYGRPDPGQDQPGPAGATDVPPPSGTVGPEVTLVRPIRP